ncbi:hypothetical protein BC943DRAFT_48324 [Umbelopsis sp. AD052]|nr:hypothetical protein BC943DRAFT_48324 [Umbelopsis sp. AD052]
MSVAPAPAPAPAPAGDPAYDPHDFDQESHIQKFLKKISADKPSIADTDPHLLAARAQAEKGLKRNFWSSRPGSEIILNERDREILTQVKRRAYYLDQGFLCCGISIGLDGVLGIIPFIGDFLGACLAVELVRTATRADLPRRLVCMMYLNVVIDFFLGIIPFLGDFIDFLFMANKKNAVLLQEHLMTRRRDELLMEKGELPMTNAATTSGTTPGQPAMQNVQSTGPTSQVPLSSNPSYPPPVANPANPPHITGAMSSPPAASPLNQPYGGNTLNQPQPASSFNQSHAGGTLNQPQPASSFNQPHAGSTLNQPSVASPLNQSHVGSTLDQPQPRNSMDQPQPVNPATAVKI